VKYLFRAMRFLWPHRWMLALYLACTVILAAISSLPLLLAKSLLNHLQAPVVQPDASGPLKWFEGKLKGFEGFLQGIFGNEPNSYLTGICVAIVFCIVVKTFLDFAVSYLQSWIAQRLQVDAMVRLMRHLLSLDIGFHDRRKMGDLVSRIIGDTDALRGTSKLTLDFLEKPPLIIVLAIGAFCLNWKLFLLGAVGVPLLVAPLMHLTRKIYKHAMRARIQAADMAEDMLQDLTGMRTVQAYEAVQAEGDNFAKLAAAFFRSSMRKARNRALQRPVSELVMGLSGVLVFAWGALQIQRGEMALNDFLVFAAACGMLYNPLRGLFSTFGEIAEFVPSAERTFEILETKPRIMDGPDAVECPKLAQAIVFEDVTLDYGRGPVFTHLNLTIKAGERIGIVGRTGIGKSSLLALLLRFYDPTEGRILVDGVDIRKVRVASLRSQMALVTQDPFLFHTTIEENIRYGKPDAPFAEVEAAARAAAVHDEILQQPEGYKTIVGERGAAFSGGQRQRIAVARAILRNAPILLLDEATSALDSSVEKLVQDALDLLSRGRTTLVVAHRLSTIRTADRIVVFSDEGGIEAVAPHDELLRTSATYRHLWERQSGHAATPIAAGHETRRDGETPRRAAD
jgi:ABC-type multidrug transport system fused ATPase/permease subunit